MEFTLQGEEAMIEVVVKDILNKRGLINTHEIDSVEGTIPAS
jgi:hypothetical protein